MSKLRFCKLIPLFSGCPFHFVDRDHEVSYLRENADALKSQQASLNEEANNLNTQMTVS